MGLRSEDSLRAEGYLGVCRLRADQADLVNLLCLKIRNDAGKIKDADLLAPRDGHACKTPRWPVRGGPIVGAGSAIATAAAARRLDPGESKPNFRSNQTSRLHQRIRKGRRPQGVRPGMAHGCSRIDSDAKATTTRRHADVNQCGCSGVHLTFTQTAPDCSTTIVSRRARGVTGPRQQY